MFWMAVHRAVSFCLQNLAIVVPVNRARDNRNASRNPEFRVRVQSELFHTSPKRLCKFHRFPGIDIGEQNAKGLAPLAIGSK